MTTKTIVVLANSMKPGGRCLAGKELKPAGDSWEIGSWVRPVADEAGAAVSTHVMSLALGHMPCLLEIVELAVAGPAPLPDQPENWLLEKEITPKSWRSLGKIEWNEIQRLLDRPQQLWNDPTCGARRVTAGYPRAMREPASLYLVQPDRIESISVWSERNPFDARRSVKGHRLARLRYAGMLHHFDVTDPDFADRHYPRIPAPNEPGIEVKLTRPDETLVCVSVTGEYQGHHYKIAAAFFEPPAESQRG